MKGLDLAQNRWSSHLADRTHQMAKTQETLVRQSKPQKKVF